MLRYSDLSVGARLLEIESWLRAPRDDWKPIFDATPNGWTDTDSAWDAAMTVATIPFGEIRDDADGRVFDHGVRALGGRTADAESLRGLYFVKHPESPYRQRWQEPPRQFLTCSAAAAPEWIRRQVGVELSLWALGVFDSFSDEGGPPPTLEMSRLRL
jgi:hypothetical protein